MDSRLRTRATRVLVVMLTLAPFAAQAADAPHYDRRWVYSPQNLLVDKNVDEVITLIRRASQSGYNGLMLADYKFNILERMPPNYFRNVERVQNAASDAGLEIIPAIFPIGYSAGLLAHDPNLAEGLPVTDAPFVVQGREAVLDPSAPVHYTNADLEEVRGDRFVGMSFQDDPGKATFADSTVAHSGKRSCRMTDVSKTSSSGNCRIVQRVKVRPHACYRFSCWLKTKDLSNLGGIHLLALGAKGRQLTFHEAHTARTQDWKQVDVVFNTLDQDEINLYAGIWGGGVGSLWIDSLEFKELALVNVLRRPGCPFSVMSFDGTTTFEERKDFEPLADPKLGQEPYAGEFGFSHDGPRIHLTEKSRIKDGEKLRVSWYHPVPTHGTQIASCLSEPKVYELLRDQARRVNALLHPKTFFMSHDELRVANWCQACRERHQSPGELLADNAKRCVAILHAVNPKAEVAVWSDMFDPNHNAVKNYYLVNGSFEGSWKGLPPAVLIANWNSGKARQSLTWFAERGHPQIIAGYYDGDNLQNFQNWNDAARGVPKVTGFMYTTWEHKYKLLDEYGKAIQGAK